MMWEIWPLKCMNLKKTKAMLSFSLFLKKRSPSELSPDPYQYLWQGKQICNSSGPPSHPAMLWSPPRRTFLRLFCLALQFLLLISSIWWFHHSWLRKTFMCANETSQEIKQQYKPFALTWAAGVTYADGQKKLSDTCQQPELVTAAGDMNTTLIHATFIGKM